jgi:hypothetical protein
MDPIDPIDRIDPAEPMDRIDPAGPIDRIEPTDPNDHSEASADDAIALAAEPRSTNHDQVRRGDGRQGASNAALSARSRRERSHVRSRGSGYGSAAMRPSPPSG